MAAGAAEMVTLENVMSEMAISGIPRMLPAFVQPVLVRFTTRRRNSEIAAASRQSAAIMSTNKPAARVAAAPKSAKPRKLSFKEARELEGMEAQIQAVEAEVARIEGLFIQPDFHRKHATQVNRLTDELEAAKDCITKLYARWEELEAIKAPAERP
jgi:ATP-binding cassette subfamily F protein uup